MKLDLAYPNEAFSDIIQLKSAFLDHHNVNLFVKRDYLIHPQVSGNKWRKLKYNLEFARENNKTTLLTFGGAFSNHIYATAAAGKLFGFQTIGIIRGDEIEDLNSTLDFAKNTCGMKLYFVDRTTYRALTQGNKFELLQTIIPNYVQNSFLILPEGGTNHLAIKGCNEILSKSDFQNFDYVCTCVGTGGTMAGIIQASQNQSHILGFSSLKGDFLKDTIETILENGIEPSFTNWQINTDYHFGGYAKKTLELEKFLTDFESEHNIPTEFVYSGKMFFGIFELIKKKYFQPDSIILAIHSGGLRL